MTGIGMADKKITPCNNKIGALRFTQCAYSIQPPVTTDYDFTYLV